MAGSCHWRGGRFARPPFFICLGPVLYNKLDRWISSKVAMFWGARWQEAAILKIVLFLKFEPLEHNQRYPSKIKLYFITTEFAVNTLGDASIASPFSFIGQNDA
ncbi:hypothetical protein [Solidesulfovibrio magneticus]|uniref:Uncharacterized protein n=1 Tax=Solidesulfovibrio magneticus (strain ATCC 700980 / DSM 13731 / RS-1) TaxID=573370 RepID=C4XKW8_SOLM1|nr:hypothetical protein [Solidesulfovibrio magneticus]BAH74507.1 hypothetical protein DMR_10160 [Solidesulfovibrio magneticus RS-1]